MNNGDNFYIKWKSSVKKKKGRRRRRRTCEVGKHFTQELYMKKNLHNSYTRTCIRKLSIKVLLNHETTYTLANFSVMSSG